MKIILYIYLLIQNSKNAYNNELKLIDLNHSYQVFQFFYKIKKEFISRWKNHWIKLFFWTNHRKSAYLGTIRSIFNDPDLHEQWYFVKDKSSDLLSHNLNYLWEQNITGKGVVIGLIGGGINAEHRDLMQNYNKRVSYNYLRNSTDILYSNYDQTTEKAGLIAAVSNNRQCGTGAAPSAQIVCLQVYDDEVTMFNYKRITTSILRNYMDISIFTIDSKYSDFQSSFKGFIKFFHYGIRLGTKFGRNKRGNIFLTGSGECRLKGYNCALKVHLQLPDVFVFASISAHGLVPEYSERCTAILAATLSSDSLARKDFLYSTTWGNLCERTIGGMAGSTSIAAGIIALLLEYNPELTQRQVMFLIVKTSDQLDKNSIRNSAGYYYSNSIGFGMLNAKELIRASKEEFITNLSKRYICKTYSLPLEHQILIKYSETLYLYSSGCVDVTYCITQIEEIHFIFTVESPIPTSVTIYLTSPSATRFKILEPIPDDFSQKDLFNMKIKILGYFGERPTGVWKIEISSSSESIIKKAELVFYGYCIDPELNLLYHLKVKEFLLSNSYYNNTFLYSQFTSKNLKNYSRISSFDYYSGWETKFNSIEVLNYL